jgi:hypothetical protein
MAPRWSTSLPALREKLDGRELVDGRFQGALELQLKLGRRDPLDFSVTRGFGLDLQVKDVEFRTARMDRACSGWERWALTSRRSIRSATSTCDRSRSTRRWPRW